MYAIYAYIDPSNHPNVGIYGIHGVSGYRDPIAPSTGRTVYVDAECHAADDTLGIPS